MIAACGGEVSGEFGGDGSGPDGGVGKEDGTVTTDAAPVEPLVPPTSTVTKVTVSTVDEFLAALAVATPGSVVYVKDGVELNLTGRKNIIIPEQVTVAGGGGQGGVGGALLYSTAKDTMPLFLVNGKGVRFTGLRLRGPDSAVGSTPYGTPLSQGFGAKYADNFQVDHSELFAWSYAAVGLDYSHNVYIHHNNIHHTQRTGLGYGVVMVHDSTALIERNTFDYNRHAIAGTGRREISYEARYNFVGPNRTSHAFDMHGENEADKNGAPWAGNVIKIHHNSFRGSRQSIRVRGRPKTGGYINNNCFAQSSGTAVAQLYYTGNLHLSSNSYNTSSSCHTGAAPGRAVRSDVNGDGFADVVVLAEGTAYTFLGTPSRSLVAASPAFAGTMKTALFDGEGYFVVDVVDVNGDGRADLVTAHADGNVYVYPGQLGGGFGSSIASFGNTYAPGPDGFEPIAVADVNGDGFGDLVSARGGTVYVHPGRADGTFGGSAQSFNGSLNSASFDGSGHFPIDVADVTGDGRADLVTAFESGDVYVYPGKADGSFGSGVASFSSTFHVAFLSGVGFEAVGVADVNGDGRADLVAAHTNGTGYVYPGTTSGAFGSRVESFESTMPTSLFGGRGFEVAAVLDIDGDGRADLVTVHPDRGIYVYSATAAGGFISSVASFLGELRTTRFGTAGYEMVNEKGALRRRGCASTGCF